jgi:hypothetical protein
MVNSDTTSNVLPDDEEEQVLDRLVRNQIKIQELQAENDLLKGYFKQRPEVYPAGLKKKVGQFYIKITSQTRVNDSMARKLLPVAVYKRLSKQVIDGPAAKKALTEAEYASIITTYDNRVEVGLND